ncbi:MAG: hypothetical protein Q8Q85_01965 [Gemmatimonadales bacterium]|nr:hypothetical protein [Gemmatimonadales bacterium]
MEKSLEQEGTLSRETLVQIGVVAGAVVAIVAAIWTSSLPSPFPWA